MQRTLLLAAAMALVVSSAAAQIGSPLPALNYKDFTGTEAQSIEDFDGRLLLIEVFAHW